MITLCFKCKGSLGECAPGLLLCVCQHPSWAGAEQFHDFQRAKMTQVSRLGAEVRDLDRDGMGYEEIRAIARPSYDTLFPPIGGCPYCVHHRKNTCQSCDGDKPQDERFAVFYAMATGRKRKEMCHATCR